MALTYEEMLAFIASHNYDDNNSVVYDALIKSINGLRNFNKTETDIINNRKINYSEYRRRLSKVLDACDIYISDRVHKTPTDTQETLNFAKKVKDTLTPLFESAFAKEKTEIETTLQHTEDREKIIEDNTKLKNLAKLQRNIGGSRIVAKRKQITAKQSKKYSFFRNVAHKIYTGLKVAGLAVGALLYDLSLPFTPTNKYIKQFDLSKKTENERIPGTKGENFENEKTLREVNEGVDNQPILRDSRRMPLIYEKKILEDPSLPPTMSLRFQQAKLGSSVSVTANQEVGHGFVALKYSKKNPITGKMERYECTFGFYPKIGNPAFSIMTAQVEEGLHVPGEVCDDYDHTYAVEKVYEVNNKKINQVILAAQQYEKEGYNIVKRNCAGFTYAMAKVAGIEPEQYMQPTDFQAAVLPVLYGFTSFGGPMMSRIGEHKVLKRSVETDYSYGNFGNKKITPETIRKFSKTEFNLRTEGYSPSQITEVIRADHGNPLSGRYTEISKIKYGDLLESVDTDIAKFQAALDKYADKHNLPELKENNAKLREYMKTQYHVLYNDSSFALKQYTKDGDDVKLHSVKQQRIACKKVANTANTFKKDLSDIFYDTYKGDPELNLLFNGYISKLTGISGYMNYLYEDLAEALRYPVNLDAIKDPNERAYYKAITDADYTDFVDFKRDDAQAIKDFLFQRVAYKFPVTDKNGNVKTKKISLAQSEVIAGIKLFGSIEQTLRYKWLRRIDENKLTKAEKKEFAEYKKKADTYNNFIKSAESILERPQATREDIEFIFSELPDLEDPSLNSNSQVSFSARQLSRPSESLKGIIFGKTLQGLKEKLKGLSTEAIINNPNLVTETIGQFFAEKMAGDAFKDIIDVLGNEIKKDYPFDKKNDTEQTYKLNLNKKVYDRLIDELYQTYLSPLLNEVSEVKSAEYEQAANADKNNPQNSLERLNQLSTNILTAGNALNYGVSKEYNALIANKFSINPSLYTLKLSIFDNMTSLERQANLNPEQKSAELKKLTAQLLAVNDLMQPGAEKVKPITKEMIDQKTAHYLRHDALTNETVPSVTNILKESTSSGNMITPVDVGLVNTFKMYSMSKQKAEKKSFDKAKNFFDRIKIKDSSIEPSKKQKDAKEPEVKDLGTKDGALKWL